MMFFLRVLSFYLMQTIITHDAPVALGYSLKHHLSQSRYSPLFAASTTSITASTHNQTFHTQHSKERYCGHSSRITDPTQLSYESAIVVLKSFYSEHGHLAIPRSYTVPSSPQYPTEFHNKKLSTIVYNMKWWSHHVSSKPERVYELNQLEFVWERLQTNWNLVLEALVVYHSIYGHVCVPTAFVVPIPVKEPTTTNGSNGSTNPESHLKNDHVNVWPKSTWGIPLGNCVHRIRTRGDFLREEGTVFSRRRQLDALGFVWDVGEEAFEKFVLALKIYKEVELGDILTKEDKNPMLHNFIRSSNQGGHQSSTSSRVLKVKTSFVVPSGEYISKKFGSTVRSMRNPWPKDLWGYPLGAKCTAVRQKELYIKGQPARQKILQDIGFQKNGNATLGWLEVMHAAAIYSRMHGRVLDVPINFVVPHPPKSSVAVYGPCLADMVLDGEWPWPERLYGLPLGRRLKDIRLKGRYLSNPKYADSRRSQLDALGFVWNPKRGRRRRSLGGLSMLEVNT